MIEGDAVAVNDGMNLRRRCDACSLLRSAGSSQRDLPISILPRTDGSVQPGKLWRWITFYFGSAEGKSIRC